MMVKYEIKKVFSHMSSKIAVSLLGVLLLVVIGFTINVNYVNGEGKKFMVHLQCLHFATDRKNGLEF